MAKKALENKGKEHTAVARALNLPVSTKHCIEICRNLRYKNTSEAKKFLEEVVALKRAVPYKRFIHNIPHKKGMSSGRFPQKAAKEVLKLLSAVEANAQVKGLNTSELKITKLLANIASIPHSGGRQRTGTKRTHLEVEVKERKSQKKADAKKMPDTGKVEKKEAIKEPVKEIKESKDMVGEVGKSAVKGTPAITPKPILHKEISPQPDSKSKAPERKELKETRPEAKSEAKSYTPEELLKRAQQRADVLNKREKEQREAEVVSKLYKEMQKKGSLRNEKVSKP